MVRGYQKRIIHLKNTENDAFDEAFFLVSSEGREMCERDLLREANRIIAECSSGGENRRRRMLRGGRMILTHTLMLLLGVAIGVIIVLL